VLLFDAHSIFLLLFFYFFYVFYFFCFFFFFSSRRRHTRCLSDWSSDVCSSDLIEPWWSWMRRSNASSNSTTARCCGWPSATSGRSEERRVGKECRSRWGRES